ncbi:MAG TPA: sialidase family protein [Ktedonobacterales bacterium]
MEQQPTPPTTPKSRRWLWLALTVVLLIAVLGGVVLAVPPLRQFAFNLAGQQKGQGTPTPTGPWYLAGGGACVKLPATPPKQITNVRVSKDSYLAHSEPEIAENPHNPLNLVGGSKFFTDPAHYRFKIGYYASFDGGCTWTDGGIFPGYADYELTSDISFAFGLRNDVYAAVLVDGKVDNPDFSGIAVSRSTDGGKTFQLPTLVHADPNGATFSDKPWIAIDTTSGPNAGDVYIAWNLDDNRSPSTPIYFSRSTDGGQTFSPGVSISGASSLCRFGEPASGGLTCDSALGAIPVIEPDGSIVVTYAYYDPNNPAADHGQDEGGDSGDQGFVGGPLAANSPQFTCRPLPPSRAAHTQQFVVRSADGGQTWSTPVDAAEVYDLPFHFNNSCFRNFSLPAFAADPTTGELYLTWADERFGDSDILLSTSSDGGQTWGAPVRVNDDPKGDGKDQFQPQVVVAPNGVVSIMFFDRRDDPNNFLVDAYLAQSTDGGKTFLPNVRVTTASSDPSVDAPVPDSNGPVNFFGDYQGLAADNQFAHVFWNDTRTGAQEIFTAAMPSVQPAK